MKTAKKPGQKVQIPPPRPVVSGCQSAAYIFSLNQLPKQLPNPKSKTHSIRLVDYHGDPAKKWYLDVTLIDAVTKKPVRKRIFSLFLPSQTPHEWRAQAEVYIQHFHQLLAEGYQFTAKSRFDELLTQHQEDYQRITLQHALEIFIASKTDRGKATLNRYRFILTLLKKFETGHKPILLSETKTHHMQAFLDYIDEKRQVEAKTWNHYRSGLYALFRYFIQRDAITKNPISLITTRRVQKGQRHLPLTLEEVSAIRARAEAKGDSQFVLFMSLCFYALIRPGRELRFMRVGDIQDGVIFIQKENAKSGKARRIEMVKALRKIVEAYNLAQYPADYYLFSALGRPGPEPVGHKYFYKRQIAHLKALGLHNRGHDLYCFKHSGAIQMIKSGFTAMEVQLMAGHENVQMTMDYLYNIGAISNLGSKADLMPEI